MSETQKLLDLLDRMSEVAREGRDFTDGMNFEAFAADRRTHMAVAMSLVLIGETARMISVEHAHFRDEHPDIDWKRLAGLGAIAAGGGCVIDLTLTWDAVQRSLPPLIAALGDLRHFHMQGE